MTWKLGPSGPTYITRDGGADLSAALSAASSANAHSLAQLSHVVDETQVVAAATHELAVSVSTVAERCQHVAGVSEDAQAAASDGVAVVGTIVEEVGRLGSTVLDAARGIDALAAAVREVEAAMSEISGISHRTRMLALNARIEAARAGEAGMGFAVVAEEVKTLSSQTDLLTERVKSHMLDVEKGLSTQRSALEDGARVAAESQEAAQEAERCIAGIAAGITAASEGISEISGMLEEQASAAGEAAQANARVLEHVASSNEAVRSNGGSVEAAAQRSRVLVELVETRG